MTTELPEKEGSIIQPSQEVLLNHQCSLVKHYLQSASNNELLQEPVFEPPKTLINLPSYIDKEAPIQKYDYKMTIKDSHGERKITDKGNLLGNRSFLFSTFSIPKTGAISFVLLTDLLDCLKFKGAFDEFLRINGNLYPIEADEETTHFLRTNNLISSIADSGNDSNIIYVTARSVFIQFGAAVVASGSRVIDDYWEEIAINQGLTPQHRVFCYSKELLDKIFLINPHLAPKVITSDKDADNAPLGPFEPADLTIMEQFSADIRDDYARQFSQGEHIDIVIPGQCINGSLELNAQFRVPKYHSKNSFLQASQINAMDVAIGEHHKLYTAITEPDTDVSRSNTASLAEPDTSSSAINLNKPIKRMLSSILDMPSTTAKDKKSEEFDKIYSNNGLHSSHIDLNLSLIHI